MVFVRSGIVRGVSHGQSYVLSVGGNPRRRSIEQASDLNAAYNVDPIHRRESSVLIIQAIVGFYYLETTLFIISTVKQKCCFH